MKRIVKITERDIQRIVKNVISEEEKRKEGVIEKLMRKLKGISDEQLNYNIKNDLPWDWKGTKEGYYENMQKSKRYTGSN